MLKSIKKSSYKKMQELLSKFTKSEKIVNQLLDKSKEKKLISSNSYHYHENQIDLDFLEEAEEIQQKSFTGKENFYEAIAAIKVGEESYYMFEAPKENYLQVKKANVIFFNIEVIQEGQRESFIQSYFVKKKDKDKPSFLVSHYEKEVTIVMIS